MKAQRGRARARATRHTLALGLSTLVFVAIGVVTVLVGDAGAAVAPPSVVNELVSLTATTTDPGCPTGITPTNSVVYSNLPAAITAAASGDTIYVCAGLYDLSNMTTYSSNEEILINKALTLDGVSWSSPYPASDTDASVNGTTQSVIENGIGLLVQSPNVTIRGFTFKTNNFNNDATECIAQSNSYACSTSIDVQPTEGTASPGSQGEDNVDVENNFFDNTGGPNYQNGDVHLGLGQDGPATDVTVLNIGDVIQSNVFYLAAGFQNSPLEISDTMGALIKSNTVDYPSDPNTNGFWFAGFDQGIQVESNTLSAGLGAGGVDAADPQTGMKFNDQDPTGDYGDGCSGQIISGNSVSGFAYDISIISEGYDADNELLCPKGPSNFTVTGNAVSNAGVYGIYVSGTTGGSLTDNDASNNNVTGYAADGYTPGEYDFYDAWGNTSHNDWAVGTNAGNGYAYPASIGEVSLTAPPTTIPPPPTTTAVPGSTPTTAGPGPTPTTTSSTVPAPKPSVTTSGVTLKSGYRVAMTVHCAVATCSGTLQLTKTISTRVEIGHTNKYRTKSIVKNLGTTRYSILAGTKRSFAVRLNATGMQLMRAATGSRYRCQLVITSAAGTTRQAISFKHR